MRAVSLPPVALLALWVLVQPGAAHAQVTDAAGPGTPARPAERRVEVTVLGGVAGGGALGDRDAQALGNQAPSSPSTTWFTTSARIDAAPAIEGRLGIRAVGRLWIEGGLNYARPDFAVDLASDTEGAANVTATSMLTQVVIDGAVQYRWGTGRFAPFLLAGAGYLRQLDDTRATAETGWVAQAGGGVRVRLAQRGFASRLALRGDVRVVWLRNGLILDDQRGATFAALAGLSVGL